MKTKSLLLAVALACAGTVTGFGQAVETVVSTGLSEPHSVVLDGSDSIYISDAAANRILRLVQANGELTILAGAVNGGSGSASSPFGTEARFFSPQGMVAARGGLVVADSRNNLIRHVSFTGAVTNIAGAAVDVVGVVDGTGTAARFLYPVALSVSADGVIYIADFGNGAIRKMNPDNSVTTIITGLTQPTAVAVGDNDDLWVADLSHRVFLYGTNGVLRTTVGTGAAGTNDAVAVSAKFNSPGGLLWMGAGAGLLVSDRFNHTMRRVYTNAQNVIAVQTVGGAPGQNGLVDGATNVARFNKPTGLFSDPLNGGFLIADFGNKAVRRFQQSTPLPAVATPTLGVIVVETDPDTGATTTKVEPVVNSVFNNDVVIGVTTEFGTQTLFTFGATPTNAFIDTISEPGPGSAVAIEFQNGDFPIPASLISSASLLPDLTVKAIGSQNGRRPSSVVKSRFQFKTATPSFAGDNAADFSFGNITTGAEMFYTLNGSDPTNVPSATVFGPVTAGQKVSFTIGTSDVLVKVRAFRDKYSPSDISSNLFSPVNFSANRISFGFGSGEASSEFIASAGQTFYAPVTLTLLEGQSMYSLQFNLQVTNNPGSPVVVPGAVGFNSMLLGLVPGSSPRRFFTISNQMFVTTVLQTNTNVFFSGTTLVTNVTVDNVQVFTNLMTTNTAINLLSVGWLERLNQTNLYFTTVHDLVNFSQAHDTIFERPNLKVIAGAFAFNVPAPAALGNTYTIRVGRPSATSDGVTSDVFIDAPTNGALLGPSPINAVKTVTVGQRRYLVGDVAPFRWFNAGDFGETNILNNDVLQVFQTAVYGINAPPPGTDFFDAMDSSDGSAGLQNGDNTTINTIFFGDGALNVDDVFVTFRRSLDHTLSNYFRFWDSVAIAPFQITGSGGIRRAALATNSVFRPGAARLAARTAARTGLGPVNGSTDAPGVTFAAGDVVGAAGQTVDVPITANIVGAYPLRVLALNLTVEPLDGSPAISTPVQFLANPALGQPAMSHAVGPANYSAVWLDDSITGLIGEASLGVLRVTIPASAGGGASYAVNFEHASASPNGLRLFPHQVRRGLVALSLRTASSIGDSLPDSWRLRHFGTVRNLLSHESADADGDGVPNWAEYRAGTDPNDASSRLLVKPPQPATSGGGFVITWPSASGTKYVIERSATLFGGDWAAVSPALTGTGWEMRFEDTTPGHGAGFYRVRVVE